MVSGVPLYRMQYGDISSQHLPGFCRGAHSESTMEDAVQLRERDSHNKNIPQSNILKKRGWRHYCFGMGATAS